MSERIQLKQAYLPPFLSQVASVTSFDTAVTLARDFGGTRLYIPKKPKPSTKLARSIGMGAADALARAYGGDTFDVPQVKLPKKVAIASAEGSAGEVARRLGVSERYVRMVRNGR